MCKTANYLPVLGGEVYSVHNESEVEVMGDVVVEGGRGRPWPDNPPKENKQRADPGGLGYQKANS